MGIDKKKKIKPKKNKEFKTKGSKKEGSKKKPLKNPHKNSKIKKRKQWGLAKRKFKKKKV
ncbi:hypothetical protein BD0084_14280 [Helicobacter pylori]